MAMNSWNSYIESINVLAPAYLDMTMDPNEFLFLILPLASLVLILVAIVLVMSRKEHNIHHKELETLNELMRTGELDKENYSDVLQGLVSKRVIDEKARERMKKLLERAL